MFVINWTDEIVTNIGIGNTRITKVGNYFKCKTPISFPELRKQTHVIIRWNNEHLFLTKYRTNVLEEWFAKCAPRPVPTGSAGTYL